MSCEDGLPEDGDQLRHCAHIIHQTDSVDALQTALLKLDDPLALSVFPSTYVPGTNKTFLMACARRGRYECCKLLLALDSASSLNIQNDQGYTALHYACYHGHKDVAFLLLSAGANVELANVHGERAYETAISGNRLELLHLFQNSNYFASQTLLPTAVPQPPGQASSLAESDNSTIKKVAMNRQEASYYYLHITEVDGSADPKLVGYEFACLATVQQALNKDHPSSISGSVFDAVGTIGDSIADLYVGRARSNHVCLLDMSISKQHAVISYIEDKGFVVRDIGSKHGTFVDEKRIASETSTPSETHISGTKESKARSTGGSAGYLKEGMTVRFGRIHCTVVRKRQESTLSKGFQPVVVNRAAAAVKDTAQQHQAAVHERVRVLLNLPESVPLPGPAAARQDKKQPPQGSERCNALCMAVQGTATTSSGFSRGTEKIVNPPQATLLQHAPAAVVSSGGGDGVGADGVGEQLLRKFGWEEGVSLGKRGGTANAPIEVHMKSDQAGIGVKRSAAATAVGGGGGQAGREWVIDEGADSEKTKAWKRMMMRYNEPR